MQKINVTTVSAVATPATVVQAVLPEYQKSKAVTVCYVVVPATDKIAGVIDAKRRKP